MCAKDEDMTSLGPLFSLLQGTFPLWHSHAGFKLGMSWVHTTP